MTEPVEFAPDYFVYAHGVVVTKKFKKPRELRPANRKGYAGINYIVNGQRKSICVHRLVAKYFLPKVGGKDFVNHINGVKSDNRVENLEWCTLKENSRHARDAGLLKTTLTREIADKIQVAEGFHKDIAKKYGTTRRNVSKIKQGVRW